MPSQRKHGSQRVDASADGEEQRGRKRDKGPSPVRTGGRVSHDSLLVCTVNANATTERTKTVFESVHPSHTQRGILSAVFFG